MTLLAQPGIPPTPGIGQVLVLVVLSALPVLTFAYFRRANRVAARMSTVSWLPDRAPEPDLRPELESSDVPPHRTRRTLPASGLPWLPATARPEPNTLELHMFSDWPADRVAREGVPVPHLFLTAMARPPVHRSGAVVHVLRLRAEPGTAIAAQRLLGRVPEHAVSALLGNDYLLPAGWLGRVYLTGGHTFDALSRLANPTDLRPTPILMRCTNARHGIDGLPDEVARHSAGPCVGFALLTEELGADVVPVSLQQPPARHDLRVARIRLDGAQLIDVRATAAQLAPLTSVRSWADDLHEAGYTFMLPRTACADATVVELMTLVDGKWRTSRPPAGTTLAAYYR